MAATVRWRKGGHVFVPDGSRWWARKYASFPTPELRDDVLRVYFTGLDEHNYGRTGYVNLDARDPTRVIGESPEPVIDVGEPGEFDDSGATAFSIVADGDRRFLYYQGWQRTERAPHLIFSGVAIDAGGGFRKHSRTPVLDRQEDDRFIRGAPFVIRDGGGFRMWYSSARRWLPGDDGLRYEIDIRHATSPDGLRWSADAEPCVKREGADEYGVGRPTVLVDGGVYRMWYAIRSLSRPYRIGYAESDDGRTWTRRDAEAGIEASSTGWDSTMICYPCVLRVGERVLMFYNGNRHGETGFGYAEAVA